MECEKLLDKVRDILGDHWFSDDGEYNNNDDVVEISQNIDDYFKKLRKGDKRWNGKESGKV